MQLGVGRSWCMRSSIYLAHAHATDECCYMTRQAAVTDAPQLVSGAQLSNVRELNRQAVHTYSNTGVLDATAPSASSMLRRRYTAGLLAWPAVQQRIRPFTVCPVAAFTWLRLGAVCAEVDSRPAVQDGSC